MCSKFWLDWIITFWARVFSTRFGPWTHTSFVKFIPDWPHCCCLWLSQVTLDGGTLMGAMRQWILMEASRNLWHSCDTHTTLGGYAISLNHYHSDVTWVSWRLSTLVIRPFVQQPNKSASKKHQNSALLAICEWISPHKGQVIRKAFPCHDVFMQRWLETQNLSLNWQNVNLEGYNRFPIAAMVSLSQPFHISWP